VYSLRFTVKLLVLGTWFLVSADCLLLFLQYIDEYRKNDTQDDRDGDGCIKGEVLSFDENIPRKAPQPGYFRRNEEKQADSYNKTQINAE
jgi:hypothetical protein